MICAELKTIATVWMQWDRVTRALHDAGAQSGVMTSVSLTQGSHLRVM